MLFLTLRARMWEVPIILGTLGPRPLGWDVGDLYMLLTSCVTMPILVNLGQTVSVMMEICQKNLTSHVIIIIIIIIQDF